MEFKIRFYDLTIRSKKNRLSLCVNHCVYGCVCFMVGVLRGFLWARHLRLVLVLRQVQMFQVVRTLPFLHALHGDPVDRSTDLMLTH